MKYYPYNAFVFGLSCLLGVLIYLLTVGALAGLSSSSETPHVDSPFWFVLLIATPLIVDLFFAFAFKVPLGGLSSHIFPSRRARLRQRFEDTP